MQFNDTSTYLGLVQDINYLLFGSSTATSPYAIADMTRNMNSYLDKVVGIILQSDGRWEWDDTNQTDLPIGTTTLVANQQDYEITGETFLTIRRVEVKDNNGNYYEIDPIDQRDIQGQSMTEFYKTPGRPLYYDKIGNSIFLYPKPAAANVTLAAGLKIYFQRTASYFTASDTTKEPGFAPLYHRILSVGAGLDYAIANEMMNKITILQAMYDKLEQGLVDFYSKRSQDEHIRMRTKKESYGSGGDRDYGGRGSDKVAFY